MKHRYKFYKKKYREYVKKFKKAEQEFDERGLVMNDQFMYSYKKFKENYNAMRDDLIEEGSKKSTVNELLNDQKYNISHLETRGYQRLLKESGVDINRSYHNIRTMERDQLRAMIDWNIVYDVRDSLIMEGYSREEIRHFISQTYFGSK